MKDSYEWRELMRVITSFVTATFLTCILFFGILEYVELFEAFSEGKTFDTFGFVFLGLFLVPIVILISTVIFYATFERWNIRALLLISLVSYWTSQLLYCLSYYILFKANNSYLGLPIELQHEISSFIYRYNDSLAPIFIIVGCLIMRRKPSWIHLNGSIFGVISGYGFSYGIVILLRSINNSLTSYFYLDAFELEILVVGALIGMVVGNIVGMRYFL